MQQILYAFILFMSLFIIIPFSAQCAFTTQYTNSHHSSSKNFSDPQITEYWNLWYIKLLIGITKINNDKDIFDVYLFNKPAKISQLYGAALGKELNRFRIESSVQYLQNLYYSDQKLQNIEFLTKNNTNIQQTSIAYSDAIANVNISSFNTKLHLYYDIFPNSLFNIYVSTHIGYSLNMTSDYTIQHVAHTDLYYKAFHSHTHNFIYGYGIGCDLSLNPNFIIDISYTYDALGSIQNKDFYYSNNIRHKIDFIHSKINTHSLLFSIRILL